MRVLVVDDDPSIRGLLEYALSVEGLDVSTASDGARGIAEAKRTRPDVVLLDVMMPKLDGFAVAEQLRADAELAGIPIIMLTARAADSDVLEGWRAGVDSYLTKPFDLALLFKELHRVTSGRLVDVA
jgi:two-component system, OmpR family, response regulator MtrA